MAVFLSIVLAIFVIGAFFKYAYKIAGLILQVTGLIFIGYVLFYLVCAAIGVDYHQF